MFDEVFRWFQSHSRVSKKIVMSDNFEVFCRKEVQFLNSLETANPAVDVIPWLLNLVEDAKRPDRYREAWIAASLCPIAMDYRGISSNRSPVMACHHVTALLEDLCLPKNTSRPFLEMLKETEGVTKPWTEYYTMIRSFQQLVTTAVETDTWKLHSVSISSHGQKITHMFSVIQAPGHAFRIVQSFGQKYSLGDWLQGRVINVFNKWLTRDGILAFFCRVCAVVIFLPDCSADLYERLFSVKLPVDHFRAPGAISRFHSHHFEWNFMVRDWCLTPSFFYLFSFLFIQKANIKRKFKEAMVCDSCNAKASRLCKCRAARYCSEACQRSHWSVHKPDCATTL